MSEILELPLVAAAASSGSGIENPVDSSWKIRRQEFTVVDSNKIVGELALYGGATAGSSIASRATSSSTESNRIGIYRYTQGGSAGNYVNGYGYVSEHALGGGESRVGFAIMHATIPDATNDFTWWVGYSMDNNSLGTYMSIFRIDRTISTTNYIATTIRAGTATNTDTGVAFDNSWHNFEIFVNADNTSHAFYIDGVLVATNTTNLPDAAMTVFMMQLHVLGAARSFDVDWAYLAFKPTSARGAIHTWIS